MCTDKEDDKEASGPDENPDRQAASPLEDLRSTVSKQVRHPYITNQGLGGRGLRSDTESRLRPAEEPEADE